MRRATGLAGLALAVALTLAVPWETLARGGGSYGGTHNSSSSGRSYAHRSSSGSHTRSHIKCESCSRDSHGPHPARSKAVDEFKRTHPKPPGCTQCEVDHVIPLSKGGRDDPGNMQWLSKEQHKEKTKRDLQNH